MKIVSLMNAPIDYVCVTDDGRSWTLEDGVWVKNQFNDIKFFDEDHIRECIETNSVVDPTNRIRLNFEKSGLSIDDYTDKILDDMKKEANH